jgi:hypothetical protein
LNYETSIFVFDYPNENDTLGQKIAPPPEGDEPPRWASRKLGPEASLDAANKVLPALDFDEQGKAFVRIVNEEMSWEPFWACVETSSSSVGGGDEPASSPLLFTVSPTCGTLAPRGGTNDFSVCCRFVVQRRTSLNGNHPHQESDHHHHQQQQQEAFLVVRTEQAYWIWRLQ